MKVLRGIVFIFLFISFNTYAGEKTTPEEVILKVKEAAKFMEKAGEAGLQEFNIEKGKWAWADTYVFVMKCDEVALYGHPNPKLLKKDLSQLKDKNGNYFFVQLCDAAKNPKGGWIEYLWPKPGEKESSRKLSFVLQVPGSIYQVGAGIYDDNVKLENLNKLLK
ncbi:MAG: cache domain-containing protein [Desulfobacterales bacterium]|nr:cache domain-containing protein [Desulfobacterales bacterium]